MVDSEALRKGSEVEKEHLDTIQTLKADPDMSEDRVCEMIAEDHLKEDPNYYDYLEVMEKLIDSGVTVDEIKDKFKDSVKTEGLSCSGGIGSLEIPLGSIRRCIIGKLGFTKEEKKKFKDSLKSAIKQWIKELEIDELDDESREMIESLVNESIKDVITDVLV